LHQPAAAETIARRKIRHQKPVKMGVDQEVVVISSSPALGGVLMTYVAGNISGQSNVFNKMLLIFRILFIRDQHPMPYSLIKKM
jgi:hypothetical protein